MPSKKKKKPKKKKKKVGGVKTDRKLDNIQINIE